MLIVLIPKTLLSTNHAWYFLIDIYFFTWFPVVPCLYFGHTMSKYLTLLLSFGKQANICRITIVSHLPRALNYNLIFLSFELLFRDISWVVMRPVRTWMLNGLTNMAAEEVKILTLTSRTVTLSSNSCARMKIFLMQVSWGWWIWKILNTSWIFLYNWFV